MLRRKPANNIYANNPAKVITVLTEGDLDDDSTISTRYHGYTFDILLSPANFFNSPNTTAMYLKYLKAIHLMDPGEFEGSYDEDVFNW